MSDLPIIDMAEVRSLCRIGKLEKCCRYLVCDGDGFKCAKHSSLKVTIDARVQRMTAQADNCEGKR